MKSTEQVKAYGVNTSPTTEENRLEERKMLKATLGGLGQMTENFQERFLNVDREIVSIHRKLDLAGRNVAAQRESEQQRSEKKKLSNSDLISKVKDNMEMLQVATTEIFDSMLKKLEDVKEDGKMHTNELKELKRDLEKKFKDLRDLIEKDFASKHQE